MRTKLSCAALLIVLVAAAAATDVSARGEKQQVSLTVLTPSKAVTRSLKLPLVNIGTIINLNTPSSDQSGAAAVMVGTARFLNRNGGLHGHPIGVVICNAKADSNQSAACARTMSDQHVVAVTGGQDTFDGVSQPILQAAGIPEIGIQALSPAALNGSNVFLFNTANAVAYSIGAAYAIHKLKDTPLAMTITDNSAADAFAAPILDNLKAMGESFKPIAKVAPANADYASIAAAIANTGAKGIVAPIGGSNLTNVINQVTQTAPNVKHFYVISNLSPNTFTKTFPASVLQKLVLTSVYPPTSDKSMSQFVKAMQAEEKRGDIHASVGDLAGRDIDAYAAIKALYAVTTGLKTISASTVMAALNKAKNVNIGPFLAPWTPTAPGPAFAPRASNTSVYLTTFDANGQLKLLLPKPVSLANALNGRFS